MCISRSVNYSPIKAIKTRVSQNLEASLLTWTNATIVSGVACIKQ